MKNLTYRWLNYVCAVLFSWALLLNAPFAHAQNLQAIPPLTALVVDQTNTLSSTEIAQLDAKLKAFEKTKGSQIGVLIVPTTAPEDIFSYSQRAAETYKLGRKGVGDGVLIVVAKNDRKIHVYVMRALEGAIPDAYAKRIINEQMQPAFRQNQFAAGLDAATTQIEKLINGEQLPAPTTDWQGRSTQTAQDSSGDIWTPLLILTLAACFIGSGIAKATSRWLVAPLAAALAGFVALDMTSMIAAAGLVAFVVGLAIMIFGKRYAQLATQHGNSPFSTTTRRRNNDIFWGGGFGGGGFGGFGGGSGGGGWGGSGGGGDAGGGGASGGW